MLDRITQLAFRYGPYAVTIGAAVYFLLFAGRVA